MRDDHVYLEEGKHRKEKGERSKVPFAPERYFRTRRLHQTEKRTAPSQARKVKQDAPREYGANIFHLSFIKFRGRIKHNSSGLE